MNVCKYDCTYINFERMKKKTTKIRIFSLYSALLVYIHTHTAGIYTSWSGLGCYLLHLPSWCCLLSIIINKYNNSRSLCHIFIISIIEFCWKCAHTTATTTETDARVQWKRKRNATLHWKRIELRIKSEILG